MVEVSASLPTLNIFVRFPYLFLALSMFFRRLWPFSMSDMIFLAQRDEELRPRMYMSEPWSNLDSSMSRPKAGTFDRVEVWPRERPVAHDLPLLYSSLTGR